jgi:hypothetical protein
MELKVPDYFWDFTTLEVGTVVYDKVRNGFRLLIMRGPLSWCSYIGVNQDSPLAGLAYQAVELQGFECHGGLTYSGCLAPPNGDIILHNIIEGYVVGSWYLGWDYGHGGDWTGNNLGCGTTSDALSFGGTTSDALSFGGVTTTSDATGRTGYINLSSPHKKWTFGEVKAEIEEAFIQMQQVERQLIIKRIQDSWKIGQVRKYKRLIRVNGAE